jgi:hypothetical protein
MERGEVLAWPPRPATFNNPFFCWGVSIGRQRLKMDGENGWTNGECVRQREIRKKKVKKE